MVKSRFLVVNTVSPCSKFWRTAVTRTPLPVAGLLAACCDEAYTSENSVLDRLKPVVELFAILLDITSNSTDAALSPVSAISKVMIFSV